MPTDRSVGTELLQRDIREQATILAGLLDGPQAQLVARARTALADQRRARFVGIGSSRHVAGYGAACVDVLAGVPALVLDSPGAAVRLPQLGPDDLVVLVSQSGATPALLRVAAQARAHGAQVWALTNGPGSPLEQVADLVLNASAGPESVIPATKSVTAMMLALRAVSAPVDEQAVRSLSSSVASLVDQRQDELARLVAAHPRVDAVVSGGFAGQWVADEVAIKLAEITAHLAVSESLVDYLHGPAAVPAPTLAFLDPADPNAAALAQRPAIVSVGASDDYTLRLDGSGDAALDAIAQVVVGQCLALHWARAAGVDPDDPRGLRKVTLTH